MDEVIKSIQSIDIVVETDCGTRTISFQINPTDQELVRFTRKSKTEYQERFGLDPEKHVLGSVYTLEFSACEMTIKT